MAATQSEPTRLPPPQALALAAKAFGFVIEETAEIMGDGYSVSRLTRARQFVVERLEVASTAAALLRAVDTGLLNLNRPWHFNFPEDRVDRFWHVVTVLRREGLDDDQLAFIVDQLISHPSNAGTWRAAKVPMIQGILKAIDLDPADVSDPFGIVLAACAHLHLLTWAALAPRLMPPLRAEHEFTGGIRVVITAPVGSKPMGHICVGDERYDLSNLA